MSIERKWKSTAGGVLSIIGGTIHLIIWPAIGFLFNRFAANMPQFPLISIWIIVLSQVILAMVSIVGGISAIRKKIWGLALAGSICAISGPISGFIGIAATVFIAISKHEFNYSHEQDNQ